MPLGPRRCKLIFNVHTPEKSSMHIKRDFFHIRKFVNVTL